MICYDMPAGDAKEAYKLYPRNTSRSEVTAALQELGVKAGMKLVVHSAFGTLGKFEGGPENFCDMLQELVTEEGTLILPGLSRYLASGEEFTFDPGSTPVRVGIVPETFRKLPGVLRSWDPTHSFCVWGKEKESFIRHHHQLPSMHENSPLGLLEKAGGYCLMAGCWTEVTFMHVVETSCGAGCLGQRNELHNAVINGKNVKLRGWGWRGGTCPALDHHKIYGFMRKNDMLAETMIGHCHLILFSLADYRTAYERLLLDPVNGCASCTIRPRQVAQCVESDWDEENDCLKETDAFVEERNFQ